MQTENLPDDIESKCHKLNNSYKKYEKNVRKAIIFASIMIAMFIFFIASLPGDETIDINPEISYPIGIVALVTLVITSYYIKKSLKDNPISNQKQIIQVYRAYNFMKKYGKDEDQDNLNAAYSEINVLVYDLKTEFGNFDEKKPSLISLHEPLGNLIHYLDVRLVPALDTEEKINIEKFQKTFQKLIEFFLSDDFDLIKSVNSDLKYNYVEQTEEIKSLVKQIREHNNLTKTFISFLIIGASSLVSYILSEIIHADITTTITWLIGISVPSVIAYLWWKSSH